MILCTFLQITKMLLFRQTIVCDLCAHNTNIDRMNTNDDGGKYEDFTGTKWEKFELKCLRDLIAKYDSNTINFQEIHKDFTETTQRYRSMAGFKLQCNWIQLQPRIYYERAVKNREPAGNNNINDDIQISNSRMKWDRDDEEILVKLRTENINSSWNQITKLYQRHLNVLIKKRSITALQTRYHKIKNRKNIKTDIANKRKHMILSTTNQEPPTKRQRRE